MAPLAGDLHRLLEAVDQTPAREVRLPLAVRLRLAREVRRAAGDVRRARRTWYGAE